MSHPGGFPIARALLHRLELHDEECARAVVKAYTRIPRSETLPKATAALRLVACGYTSQSVLALSVGSG